jgi:hypothetical protein
MDQVEAIDALRAWVDEQRIDGVAVISDCVREREPCLYVYVTSPEAARHLPAEFEGFKLVVESGDPVHIQGIETDTSEK